MNRLYKMILVPIDGSQLSLKAVKHAVEIASKMGSKIVLLHVIDARTIQTFELTGADRNLMRARMKNTAEKYLEEALTLAQEVPAEKLILEGIPAEEIIREVADRGADLVVIGSKGMSGARRVVVGSTAEEVARWCHCPVLIVK